MTIWVDQGGLGSTATGTGVDETTAVDLVIPGTAVELVSIRVHAHSTAPAPAESLIGVTKLSGKDWNQGDFQFFSEIGGSHLGAINGNPYYQEPTWWHAFQPVVPGGNIGLSWEGLDALAGNGAFRVDCKWSDVRTGRAPINRKCTRETATSTSTAAGLTLSGASRITQYVLAVFSSTVAADDPSSGSLSINSGNLLGQQTMSLGYNLHGIEATSGQEVTSLQKADVDILVNPQKSNSVTFSGTLTEDVALGTAGGYAYQIAYHPVFA